jgi:prepilin-type N-terminal cleavage/methylation domain-containing protein
MKILSPNSNHQHSTRRGFSLMELLLSVAVISMVIAVGVFAVSNLSSSTRNMKLQSDVASLNGAIRTFLVNGGQIPASANGESVLAILKSGADASSGQKLAALRGSVINRRLRGHLIATAGEDRAIWNAAKQRFEIAASGSGFRSFDLGGSDAGPATETARRGTMDLATRDNWVWDYKEGSGPNRGPTTAQTHEIASAEATAPAAITRLAAPDFSIKGGLYDFSAFAPSLSVSLIDRNNPGLSTIYYSIENGPWLEYRSEQPLAIPPALLTSVRAYAVPLFGESYEASEVESETYETIYFTGTSSGLFYSPRGDSGLVTNLLRDLKLPQFLWGTSATSDKKQNELTFRGESFRTIAPDQEFKLGTLSYYNGTTFSGTNATSVQIGIELNMSTPTVKETLAFEFKLLSTPNKGKDANADADYVYIPDVSTNFRTSIKGKTFALVLRFGEHTSHGFTTIDTFHAHEGKLLTGTIYGRLTEVK